LRIITTKRQPIANGLLHSRNLITHTITQNEKPNKNTISCHAATSRKCIYRTLLNPGGLCLPRSIINPQPPIIMGKGMKPKKGYNQKKYLDNYDSITWGKPKTNTQKKKK